MITKNNISKNDIRTALRYTTIGLVFGVTFFLIDSLVDTYIYYEGTFLEQLFYPSSIEIWMRLFNIFLFLLFSFVISCLAIQRKRVEEELHQALLEKDLLIKEIHHRVKNSLTVVQSLLGLQIKDISDEKSRVYFHETKDRVKSMAMVYEMLLGPEDLTRIGPSEYVQNLVSSLFHSYRADSQIVNLKYDIDDIELDVDTIIPLGLIINELVSNALKHAFSGGREGELLVSLQKDSPGKYKLIVKDTGIGLPESFNVSNTESLGLKIVSSLVAQLQGTIKLGSENGTEFHITFADKSVHN